MRNRFRKAIPMLRRDSAAFLTMLGRPLLLLGIFVVSVQIAFAGSTQVRDRRISGTLVDDKGQVLTGISVIASGGSGAWGTTTDGVGQFTLNVPNEDVSVCVEGPFIKPQGYTLPVGRSSENLRFQVEYRIPPIHQSLVITASALEPQVETLSDEVYKKTLFSRDDQLLETLNAGINAGQHEGGGKSLEIRRFGFNLDHGGVNGGLKVLVDDVQQNQGTQGHGQGYLGALKTLTPELIQDVNILNGPFSAEYGDFSGLGVVHIRLKESLSDQFTARIQGGSFGSQRTFLGYSPSLARDDAFLAYEGSRTDGPFRNPLLQARQHHRKLHETAARR
jgi:TonB-dependent Receptor Plug Domain/Carboxypeptidase regulatory-like domain